MSAEHAYDPSLRPSADVGEYGVTFPGPPAADEAYRHSLRFRRVSTRYPRRVAEAYDGDLARAAADSDEQVATTVRAWELAHGIEPRDWRAIGAEERGEVEAA